MAVSQPVLEAALREPYPLTDAQRQQFRDDGYLHLQGVLGSDVLHALEPAITADTLAHDRNAGVPLEDRDTYGKAFIQVGNLWQRSEEARQLTFSRRLAEIAASLLDTRGVRLWHDQALYKEPSGGFTPWHADQQYWPMASSRCVTAWIPLHAVPLEMGPLSFARGSHLKKIGRELAISDESEQLIQQAVSSEGLREVIEPFEAGDVSFHLGWTLHRAGPNTTASPRKVHTVIYMDIDMRMAEPRNAAQRLDHETWTPSSVVGSIMADPLNPVLFESAIV
jgi:ectoine hydroxylase-related dioxygenase (phytanoyl-CoA dioxygenase family)